jgi:hypothetical protein
MQRNLSELVKYVVIFFSAFATEIFSTFYITAVSEKNTGQMIFFAVIRPFLALPFAGYMLDSKNWNDRIKMAIALSIGYAIGSVLVIWYMR